MTPIKILSIFGTRPEAIKMAPVVKALAAHPKQFNSRVCVTAQHRDMLDQVLQLFGITPDHDLNVMTPGQTLFEVTSAVLLGLRPVLEAEKPDMVLVHGDTTTTMAASLACFYLRIPVGHVEAGLRTFDRDYPFPEEMNRVVTDYLASLYFAPTSQSCDNLRRAGLPEKRIILTGNTVIDALHFTLNQSTTNQATAKPLPVTLTPGQRLVLVTVHRRENFGPPLLDICDALLTLAEQFADVHVVIPVHPNPNVQTVVHQQLGQHPRISLIPPQEYVPFCQLMHASTLILTDSGGVQEEAPSLSKPVLVLRDETERPEAVTMGTVKLVGPHKDRIITEASILLTDPAAYAAMAQAANPYGDGKATERILAAILAYFADASCK
jgi:UDP-N-acetylglucosamine 2-epimerase (non-hydrolysing)